MARTCKAVIEGSVCDGSRKYVTKEGVPCGTLRVFDGSDVLDVRVQPVDVDRAMVGTRVRIGVLLKAWQGTLNAESLNGVEILKD